MVLTSPSRLKTQSDQHDNGWCARLKLGFCPTAVKTVLAERERYGPLAVQRAFYPEGDCCHVYLLHPPGGVAGGDRLEIIANSHAGSRSLLTTPGATKFYHSAGPQASVRQQLNIAGEMEWLPQENIFFPGADVDISTRVNLEADARFIGWEINCLGRPVIDERFDAGSACFRFEVFRDGLPVLCERLLLRDETALNAPAGLRGNRVFATLYATCDDDQLCERLRSALPPEQKTDIGITQVDGLLIARYLGNSTETAKKLFVSLWQMIRPNVLLRPACEPRIWHT